MDVDELDQRILHALAVDGRAPFARVGEVLGVSDRTVARRFARMRESGVVRLSGVIDATRLGGAQWIVRVHCRPGTAVEVAQALTRRDDTRWVHLLSGGTEISASVQSWSTEERDELLLRRLQHTARITSVTAHGILHVFGGGPDVLPTTLSDTEVAALRPAIPAAPTELTDADRPLLRELARDGRAGYARLAAATGWSESTAARRLEALRAAGLLSFDVDVSPARFGYHASAQLWATVPPSQLAETGTQLATHPEVAFCAATTGPTNLLISTVCRDNRDLFRYLTQGIGTLPAVSGVETSPIIRTLKRASTFNQ